MPAWLKKLLRFACKNRRSSVHERTASPVWTCVQLLPASSRLQQTLQLGRDRWTACSLSSIAHCRKD